MTLQLLSALRLHTSGNSSLCMKTHSSPVRTALYSSGTPIQHFTTTFTTFKLIFATDTFWHFNPFRYFTFKWHFDSYKCFNFNWPFNSVKWSNLNWCPAQRFTGQNFTLADILTLTVRFQCEWALQFYLCWSLFSSIKWNILYHQWTNEVPLQFSKWSTLEGITHSCPVLKYTHKMDTLKDAFHSKTHQKHSVSSLL